MRHLRAAAAAAGVDVRALVLLQGALLFALRKKAGEDPLTPEQRVFFICTAVGLTLLAGLMSGLTLGLMSMDIVDLEVGRRRGLDLFFFGGGGKGRRATSANSSSRRPHTRTKETHVAAK
jgi:hypothetical protein